VQLPQCSAGVMCSHHRVPVTRRAAAFCTDCSRRRRPSLTPVNRELQQSRRLEMNAWGGRHYSDRLCSDRRYSDNPQSGRPSTSLARLSLCRNSRNWNGSRRWMHQKRGIDRGTEVTEGSRAWGGYPSGSGVPLLRKSYNVLPHNCTAPDFRDLVRRLSSQ